MRSLNKACISSFLLFRTCADTSEVIQSSVPRAFSSTEEDGSNTIAAAGLSPETDNINEPNSEDNRNSPTASQSRIIKVHRGNIRKDLIEIFQDPLIMKCHLIVEMLDERGMAEKGRGSGVFKDALSLFWKDVYDSLMLGEGERVPFIRHDYQRNEWEAIARILLKGYQEYQYFPLRLSKTFVVSAYSVNPPLVMRCLWNLSCNTSQRMNGESFKNAQMER